MKANRNSFQAIMKVYRATPARAGAESGSTIRRMTPSRVQPSTNPAYSSSGGRVMKYPRSMYRATGRVWAQVDQDEGVDRVPQPQAGKDDVERHGQDDGREHVNQEYAVGQERLPP